ncbi:MAG: TorF family putative porin [Pseudomonadales bacterium]
MKKLSLYISGLVLSLASLNSYALDVSGNVSLASDYVYRGISQTNEEATIQGGFDLSAESGFYAGVWASNIAFDGSIEIDIYGGFAKELNEEWSIDVGLLRYEYPNNAGPNESSFNEVYGSLSFRELSVGVAYSDDFFFESDSSIYIYVNYSLALPNDFGVDFHYGNQSIDDNNTFGTPDYADYSISLSKSVAELDLSLTWYDTDLSGSECFGGADVCDSRIVFGLSKSL